MNHMLESEGPKEFREFGGDEYGTHPVQYGPERALRDSVLRGGPRRRGLDYDPGVFEVVAESPRDELFRVVAPYSFDGSTVLCLELATEFVKTICDFCPFLAKSRSTPPCLPVREYPRVPLAPDPRHPSRSPRVQHDQVSHLLDFRLRFLRVRRYRLLPADARLALLLRGYRAVHLQSVHHTGTHHAFYGL